jgi:hypothetical protein
MENSAAGLERRIELHLEQYGRSGVGAHPDTENAQHQTRRKNDHQTLVLPTSIRQDMAEDESDRVRREAAAAAEHHTLRSVIAQVARLSRKSLVTDRILSGKFLQRSICSWSLDDHSATSTAEGVATPRNAQLAIFDQRLQGLNDRVGVSIGSRPVRSLILLPLRECPFCDLVT